MLQPRPLSSGSRYSGGQGVCLITSSRMEEASLPYPASGTRLEADPVPLELAEWWHQPQVSCWRTKSVKCKISRHSGGPEDKRIGSGGPPCSPSLCHPVDEIGQLDAMGWLVLCLSGNHTIIKCVYIGVCMIQETCSTIMQRSEVRCQMKFSNATAIKCLSINGHACTCLRLHAHKNYIAVFRQSARDCL